MNMLHVMDVVSSVGLMARKLFYGARMRIILAEKCETIV